MELTLVVTLPLHWALPPCAHICMRIIEISVYNHTHACMEVLILNTFYADQRKIFICPHWLGNSAWSQQTKVLKTLHLPLGKEKCLILIIWRYFFLIFKNVLNWCLYHSLSLRGYWWWILKNGNQPTSLDLKSMHFCSLLCLEKKKGKTCYLLTPFSTTLDSFLYNNNLILLKILGTFCDRVERKNTLADLKASKRWLFWNEEVEFSALYSKFAENKNTEINTIDSLHYTRLNKAIICLSRL